MTLSDFVRIARGESPADLVLRNARLVNILSGEVESAAMSFLGLEVIPALKLTDQGLVDVDRGEIVPLFVGG